jgi:hypothetical protein
MKWGDQDYPRQPAQLSMGFRKIKRRLNVNNVCMICTNQVRMNMKGSGGRKMVNVGDPQSWEYTGYGGLALRFWATHRVFMYAKQSRYKLLPTSQFPDGLVIGFHTVKNRLRMPLRDGRMVLLFGATGKMYPGLCPEMSMLEDLVLSDAVEIGNKEKGKDYTIKFGRFGINPTTFDPKEVTTTLDQDDERPAQSRRGSKKEPSFVYRAEWPEFYEAHKADIDLLWNAAIAKALSITKTGSEIEIEAEPDDTLKID